MLKYETILYGESARKWLKDHSFAYVFLCDDGKWRGTDWFFGAKKSEELQDDEPMCIL